MDVKSTAASHEPLLRQAARVTESTQTTWTRQNTVSLIRQCGIHGLGQVLWAVEHNDRISCVAWVIILVICATCSMIHCSFVIIKATNTPVFTHTSVHRTANIPYPHLTICNHRHYMLDFDRLYADNITLEEAEVVLSGLPVYGRGLQGHQLYLNRSEPRKIFDELIVNNTNNGSFSEQFMRFFDTYSHKCEEVFILCKNSNFQPFNCCEAWRPIFHAKFGKCFTFDRSSFIVKTPGRFSAIYIDLKYFPTTGGYITFRNGDGIEQGLLSSHQINFGVTPHETHIRIKATRYKTNSMYDCVEHTELKYFQNYTFDNCMYENGFFDKLVGYAGCIPPILVLTKQNDTQNPDLPECSIDQIFRMFKNKPMVTWMRDLNISETNLCPPLCDRWEYELDLYKEPNYSQYVYVKILYDQTHYNFITDDTALDWHGYLSLVGGNLGFWLGASIVTLLHFPIILCSHYCCPTEKKTLINNNRK